MRSPSNECTGAPLLYVFILPLIPNSLCGNIVQRPPFNRYVHLRLIVEDLDSKKVSISSIASNTVQF
jgi:hypothetical protein